MDLYAPITQSLANTQATIVDLMKVFMSNEIAKQNMELEKTKLEQTSRGLDLEADRNRLAVIKEQAAEDRARQAREDALRARGEDVAFRTSEAERAATHQANVESNERLRTNLAYDTLAADKEYKTGSLGLHGREVAAREAGVSIEKQKFDKQYGNTTIGKIGQQMGVDPYVWGYLNIDKDAVTTPENFQKMLTNPQVLYGLPRAAIIRHSEQLKTIEKSIVTEQDPAKKEQMKKNYDALSGQIRILQDTLEKGLPKELLTSVIKGMGITDPEEAAKAVETLTEKWKTIKNPADLTGDKRPSAKFDEANPAGMQEITAMLSDVKAGKYKLSPVEMQTIRKMTSNVTPQRTDAVRKALANILGASQKITPAAAAAGQDDDPFSQPGLIY